MVDQRRVTPLARVSGPPGKTDAAGPFHVTDSFHFTGFISGGVCEMNE
jgi:hypothetical protein